jgi:hypothetical protein
MIHKSYTLCPNDSQYQFRVGFTSRGIIMTQIMYLKFAADKLNPVVGHFD